MDETKQTRKRLFFFAPQAREFVTELFRDRASDLRFCVSSATPHRMTKQAWGPADVAALKRLIRAERSQKRAAWQLLTTETSVSRWLLGGVPRNWEAVRAALGALGYYSTGRRK
jgi:hypothetical protein